MTAPYGTWRSPLTAADVAAGALRLGGVALDGRDTYWLEGRPGEGGRSVLVRRSADGRIADVTPPDANVRTRAHEYGGGACLVSQRTVYYTEFTDQRVYRQAAGGAPEPLTPPGPWFYADFTLDPRRPRLVCVREDHGRDEAEPVNTLVSLALDGSLSAGEVIVLGHDFYSTPRFSPDGSRLAWLAWRHPHLPWDATELWVADVVPEGGLEHTTLVAGGDSESIFQPGWSPDGTLYFVSDRTGWWNLYRLREARIEPLHPLAAEFGRPQWQFGTSTWAFSTPKTMVASYAIDGRWRLAAIDVERGTFGPVETAMAPGESIAAGPDGAVFVGSSSRSAPAVVRLDLATGATEVIRTASASRLDSRYISEAEAIDFPTDGGLTARGWYYAPRNPDFAAPPGERPPLIVVSHGGPTAAASTGLNLEVQYWTSRGFAVADVDYGGSSGYGRAYRQRLNGQWGIVDVADCVNAARFLVSAGKADGSRLVIRGRSAGGYTTLAALTFRPEVFKAGASYYGVADLEALARDTHKFEARYLDGLVGPYPARRDLYRARSPIHFVDRLSCPLILFQGLEDKVVPPNQARLMADAVRAKGLPVALVVFEEEQHGFRRAETIVRCLEAELFFYGAVFGFTPADALEPIPIDNRTS